MISGPIWAHRNLKNIVRIDAVRTKAVHHKLFQLLSQRSVPSEINLPELAKHNCEGPRGGDARGGVESSHMTRRSAKKAHTPMPKRRPKISAIRHRAPIKLKIAMISTTILGIFRCRLRSIDSARDAMGRWEGRGVDGQKLGVILVLGVIT